MHGEIITIGSELISGRTLDLNSWYAAGRLTASGLGVNRITSVGDDEGKISEALRDALNMSRFVIITGGLGSTDDDITNKIAANTLDRPLSLDTKMYEKIRDYLAARGAEMTAALKKMALMPEGAKLLDPKGATCGFSLVEGGVRLYFLPGVPDQTRYLIDKFVLPELLSLYDTLPVMRQRTMKMYGLSEPEIAGIFRRLRAKTGDVVLGFYPDFPENHVTISLRGRDEPAITDELDRIGQEISSLVGPCVFTSDNLEMEDVVGGLLIKSGKTISVAESCTGGRIGDRLTNVAGSSGYFEGGVITYSNQSKVNLISVSPKTLEKHGAVSDDTVREMARGIRERMKTDLGLAVTGIAGPEGGSREKPLGTVHFGLSAEQGVFSRKYRFWGSRRQVKMNASTMALDWVRRYLHGDPFLPGI